MLINPPPDVRLLVDKTAAMVAKMGRQFEERLQADSRTNPKLGFMNANDPYHPYYRSKLSEFQEMGPLVAEAFLEDIRQRQAEQQKKESNLEEADEMVKAPAGEEPRPPPFYQCANHTPTVAALDLDVIKLVALAEAKHGKAFTLTLAQRESRNPQFDFLQPRHSHHPLFLRLVDQYQRVMLPAQELFDRLALVANDRQRLLAEEIRPRVEWARHHRRLQALQESKEEAKQAAQAAVDWHDFWVADRIEFSPSDAQNPQIMTALDPHHFVAMSAVERESLWRSGSITVSPTAGREDDDAMEIEDDSSVPAMQRFDPPQKCPNCGQVFPSSQMAEHLRVEMLDPRWAEQRRAYQAKHADTNLLNQGSEIERNLARMQNQR